MELLDEMAERELREEVKGMEGNALYIGPRSGDNEATPPIQRMTRGDTIRKRNWPNSVNETMHTTQKVTRDFFLGRRNELRKSTNDFATRGSQRPM